jgi:formylglycine-generating enzyme required for sulfatase activity
VTSDKHRAHQNAIVPMPLGSIILHFAVGTESEHSMDALATALFAAISAAARATTSGIDHAADGETWAAAKAKLNQWARLTGPRQRAAFERVLARTMAGVGNVSPRDAVGNRAFALLSDASPEVRSFRQTLVEELLFSARPNLGRLADQYRRDLRFLSLLAREPMPAWSDLERRIVLFAGQLRLEMAAERVLRPLLLEQAELEALDVTRATARNTEDAAATLSRVEALLVEMTTLPRISASVSAEQGASINHAPVTVVMGDQHSYTIAPVVPTDLRALYRRYCEFITKSFGTLDFRGIVQVQNVVRLRLEEVYVPLRAGGLADVHATTASTGSGKTKDLLALLDKVSNTRTASTLRSSIGQQFILTDSLKEIERDNSLHTFVRDRPFLVVLGDPGTGKSTLVRMIMLALAEGRGGASFGLSDEWLPIFFPIAAFAEVRADVGSRDIAPLAYLRDYYRGREQPDYTPLFERALLAGRALLLLDGLDEVREDRLAIVKCLEDFIRAWDAPGNRFLATSRIAGYEDAPLDDALFERATVQPFSDEDIRKFAENWSLAFERAGVPGANPADLDLRRRAEARTHELSTAIFTEPNVTALARNPLLLTILALIHNQGTRLPDRRVDLYQLCVQALAETWNRARSIAGREIDVYLGTEKLDERFVINLLGPAALWIHAENPGGIVDERDLERKLAETLIAIDGLTRGKADRLAADFLRLVNRETGLLLERGHRRYSFLHLTFEEYLAGRALIDSAAVEDADAEIHRRAADPGWREVLRLALASASQKEAQRLLLHLLDAPTDASMRGRPVVLAGECLLDIGRNGATRRAWDAVVGALLVLLVDPAASITTRVEGGHVLGRLGDPRLLDACSGEAAGFGAYAAVETYWCDIEAGPFWFGDDQIERPESGRRNQDKLARQCFDSAKLTCVELPHSFKIGRYPVTNAEFACFLEANGPNGYDPAKPCWTQEGRTFLSPQGRRWALDEKHKGKAIFFPRLWDDSRYNSPSQPIVGVSWYEAAAYCNWLMGEGHQHGWLPQNQVIRLPTSLEWERAARHTDTRPFPWGNATPTGEHANVTDAGVGAPSPVGCFRAGRAVCGADDLVGNVLEWLATPYGAGADPQPRKDVTLNSGIELSFTHYGDEVVRMCCGARYWYYPDDWYYDRGFRVVRSLALSGGNHEYT